MENCLNCNEKLINTPSKKTRIRIYCDSKCQNEHKRNIKIQAWLNGENAGRRGKTGTARWIKHYLIKIRGERCGWSKRNEYTGNIPIELEHIDGNFTNNDIKNLILLCPNCHSLTSTYKGANKEGRPRKQYFSRKKINTEK